MGKNRKIVKTPKPESLDLDPDRLVSDLLSALALVDATAKPLARFSAEPSNLDDAASPPGRGRSAIAHPADDIGMRPAPTSGETASGGPADILEQLRLDAESMRRMQITPHEFEALSRASLLGSVSSRQDFFFMLRTIRESTAPAPEHTTGAVYSEMAEDLRRDSLRKLLEGDSCGISVRRRKAWHLLIPSAGILAAALILLLKLAPHALPSIDTIARFKVLVTARI